MLFAPWFALTSSNGLFDLEGWLTNNGATAWYDVKDMI